VTAVPVNPPLVRLAWASIRATVTQTVRHGRIARYVAALLLAEIIFLVAVTHSPWGVMVAAGIIVVTTIAVVITVVVELFRHARNPHRYLWWTTSPATIKAMAKPHHDGWMLHSLSAWPTGNHGAAFRFAFQQTEQLEGPFYLTAANQRLANIYEHYGFRPNGRRTRFGKIPMKTDTPAAEDSSLNSQSTPAVPTSTPARGDRPIELRRRDR
jgi:hypothetical protein